MLKVMAVRYFEVPDKLVSAANGIDYAYREIGEGTVPLVQPGSAHGFLFQYHAGFGADLEAFLGEASETARRTAAGS
jgi:hypothetical protein